MPSWSKVKPGDMGFDVLHMNLHKNLATPMENGGLGADPVGVSEAVAHLPLPVVAKETGGGRRRSAAVSLVRVR